MADDLGIMLTELPEAESISDNDLLYLVKENNSEKVKGLTLKNAVNKIQVPEVISTGDKACYVKRAIPTAGALAEGQKIVGATLAWNQLLPYTSASSTSHGITFTNNQDGTWTLTGTTDGSTAFANLNYDGTHQYITNHVYFQPKCTTSTKAIGLYSANVGGGDGTGGNACSSVNNDRIFKCTLSSTASWSRINVATPANEDIGTVVIKPQMFDLTLLFGSTIADAIYQMEQTTAGSGVAFFRKYFPEDYYAYDAGSLQSVNVSSHKAYDSNASEVSSITLDSSKEFRGLYQSVNGELRANGDVYEADGTVTRKYGIVDLGSLNWDSVSNQRFASAEIRTNVKIPTNTSTAFNGVCAIFNTASNNDVYNHTNDRIIAVNGSGDVVIYYSQYESYTAAQVKTALNGIYLVYELATPTTETATPYTNPQLVDADGTEEFVDYKVSQGTRDVAIPVGHESSFYDYTDGSITIPDLPFADGTYALSVTMNNGTPTFSWESNS